LQTVTLKLALHGRIADSERMVGRSSGPVLPVVRAVRLCLVAHPVGYVHFIHVKSPHGNALPLIITHGWPGWVIEPLGVVGPLTDPAAAMLCERMSLAPYTLAPGAVPSRR
jgi:hypothetical protein